MEQIRILRAKRAAGEAASPEELTSRQELTEMVQAANLDVDSAVAELANEQSELGTLRATLQTRRDKTVSRLTTAALLTGSGLGTAVSATQFTSLGNRTANVGDGLGVGSGITSTVLSILAARRQSGPSGSIGETPNMLAPLLGGSPVLDTDYAPSVLQYLHTAPAGEDPALGTRLQQLKSAWQSAGRLGSGTAESHQAKLKVLTTSNDPDVKISINDLADRIAMLGDVRGRISLMKRDLAAAVHALPMGTAP